MKLKKKNCIIALIVVLLLLIEIINPLKIISKKQLSNLNYSDKSINYIIKYGLKNKIVKLEYNSFIDQTITDKNFNTKNFNIYKDISCSKVCDAGLANKLIAKGYNGEEITYIMKTGTVESINAFLLKDKYSDLSKYLNYDFSELDKIDRYIEYKSLNICTYDEAVVCVNMGLDGDYDDYVEVKDFSYTMLVNKKYKLSSDFKSYDLVNFPSTYCNSSSSCAIGNRTMVEAFIEMGNALTEETGLKIFARSAYRSYEEQEKTYNEYLELYGEKYAKEKVALPGSSEHQTGLSVDIRAGSNSVFKGTQESEWLKLNAYKYGFILRYEKKYENITGYSEELWHYRYVGVDVAEYIHTNKITFDEYYVRFISVK